MKRDGVLDHLHLGKQWDGSGLPVASDYEQRMATGLLDHTEIGPVRLADYLGVSMKEFIRLCYPAL